MIHLHVAHLPCVPGTYCSASISSVWPIMSAASQLMGWFWAAQLTSSQQQLGNASAKAAIFEERYQEERALRRKVCLCYVMCFEMTRCIRAV